MHELGSDNVLLALIVFEDASTQTREPLYCIFASALVAQWFTRSSPNQEVLGSRPEVDTGGALVV